MLKSALPSGKYGLCFTVGIFVWAIAGMITGQVQNMRHLAGVARE